MQLSPNGNHSTAVIIKVQAGNYPFFILMEAMVFHDGLISSVLFIISQYFTLVGIQEANKAG